ncbi:SCO family protein [Bacillus massiliigorillae]|uniref:SCO family protein n=1 Tax=Bacillus massiliigorillae TaxID=1243664 RepID=UPI0003A2B4C1|nr:SCO family protein [Bacillus massiliigorillae]
MFSKKILATMGMILILVIVTACGNQAIPNSKDWPVEDFTFTNQDNEKVSLKDLKGKVWVANFIFTNCNDVCLPMTANMSKLQAKLKAEGIKDVELISFSIDPTVDSPEVLKQFGDKFKANYSNWDFLTGYEQATIEEFAENSFKTLVKKPETGDQVLHGTSFALINEEGTVVQTYAGLESFPIDEIIKHIKILQNY